MSWNNITPAWMLQNPYQIPHKEGWWVDALKTHGTIAGPFKDKEEALKWKETNIDNV